MKLWGKKVFLILKGFLSVFLTTQIVIVGSISVIFFQSSYLLSPSSITSEILISQNNFLAFRNALYFIKYII